MIMTKEILESVNLNKDCWATPDWLFQELNKEFNFTLDPCCLPETAKCSKYYTPIEDGLSKSWKNEVVFVNPPYSRGNIDKWVRKCQEESKNAVVVALLPVSTSSKWFHKYIYQKTDVAIYQG